jgi:Inner membrane protein YgaP-like, transmembrane domain
VSDQRVDWLLSTQGRLARIAAGTILILLGLGVIGGFIGILLLIIGAVPIASAAYGALLIGPLFGRDTMGRRPEDQQQDEEKQDEDDDSPARAEESGDDSGDDSAEEDTPEADPDWSAPPLARAERPEGQEARTRDLRSDGD